MTKSIRNLVDYYTNTYTENKNKNISLWKCWGKKEKLTFYTEKFAPFLLTDV